MALEKYGVVADLVPATEEQLEKLEKLGITTAKTMPLTAVEAERLLELHGQKQS